jgi:hypothetical protein
MVPPSAANWDAQEEAYRTGATTWDDIHQQIVRDNAVRRAAADSRGFDAAHEAGATLAEEAKTISEWHDGLATKCTNIANVLRETATAQEQLVRDADAAINAAKLPGEREAIVGAYHTQARTQTGWGVEAATALHTSFKASAENTRALGLLTKFGDLPTAPPVQPVDNTSPGITQDDNPKKKPPKLDAEDAPTASPPTDATGNAATQSGVGPGAVSPGKANSPATQAPSSSSVPRSASPLGGKLPSMPGVGGGGGIGSGGMPSVPGGLGSGAGMSGLSSNPLTGGLGGMPGAAGGLPAASGAPAAAGAGSPAAAFSRGLSTGAGIGGGMPAMPPTAPATPSPALSPGVAAAPAAAAGAGGVSAAAAQPGMVGPAATAPPAASAGAGMGSGAPMMLPPGSMGPPAGAVPPPAAPTMPAGTIGGGSNASSSAAPPPSAGGGATLIPASVVAAGQTAAARERRESADAAAAKELAWKLQHAAVCVNYTAIEWAVGVFRSPSGTEMVLTSNDGASFIPHGVHVPRSARLLAADPLVDDHFRQLWFGWSDPAHVLVEYARTRAETGWRLAAAATTGAVTALRDAGVEHPPSCSRDVNPLLRSGERPVAAPTLDGLHVHRLSLLCPDMYPRLLRVMEAHPLYQDRIVNAVSALMLNAATSQAVAVADGIPDAFRRVWSTRGSPVEPSAQDWAAYDAQAPNFNMHVAMARPGFLHGTDPSETIDDLRNYRAHWLVARTAEHIAGWSTRPLPLPDMCYAAMSLERHEIRELIEDALSSVEDDLRAA